MKIPIGRHFGVYDQEDFGAYEIVGVVANAKYTDPREEAKAMFFEPLSQWQHNLKDPIFVNLETQTHYITSIVMEFHGTQQNLEVAVRARWRMSIRTLPSSTCVLSISSSQATSARNA